ncbi:MAG: TIGR04086 family membrane protein [Clostridia bacterium]|nr:TIGR04086 family membrane protein [Clostridia bacterium]MBR5987482.1 TIGR04086 family membrane protein [Clostridia bacterium]
MEKGVVRSVLDVVKTVVVAVLISMVLVLVFALIVKATSANDTTIAWVNQGIKIVSVLVGALIGFRRGGKGGWLKGLIAGLLYVVTSFLVFAAISGDFSAGALSWTDVLIGAVVGLLCGVIAVNVKKSAKNT